MKHLNREGKVALCQSVNFTDPTQVEIAGLGGLDALICMIEYTSIDFFMLEHLIRAAENVDVDFIVRIPETNTTYIKRVVDLGAHGIYLPHDGRGVDGIKQGIAATRYPPEGNRSVFVRARACGYGFYTGDTSRPKPEGYYTDEWQTYKNKCREELIIIAPVEDKRAFDEIEEIAALDGVDLLFVSVFDIADAIGVPYTETDAILEKWEWIANVAQRYGKKLVVPYDHSALKIKPQDLLRFNAGLAMIVPDATTLLYRAYQQKAQEIRAGLATAASEAPPLMKGY